MKKSLFLSLNTGRTLAKIVPVAGAFGGGSQRRKAPNAQNGLK